MVADDLAFKWLVDSFIVLMTLSLTFSMLHLIWIFLLFCVPSLYHEDLHGFLFGT